MSTYGTKTITVKATDNGFIVEWNSPAAVDRHQAMMYQQIGGPPPPPTSGTEVFVDKKKLHQRIKTFLGL